ncbi:MAG: peptidoglycan-associated lipoprotein Pal [Alphaproteobacteria bacterium]|nr:peptidoglycan-associated lipoprotein Pal [Alphaproteobacteria bacterium]
MRLKITTMIAALFVVAACATAGEEEAATSGAGGGAQAAAPARVEQSQSGASEQAARQAPVITPGSAQDLVANVGDRVFFDFDKFDLRASSRTTLERQSAWLKRFPNLNVTIEGHADERGTREYNLALGERRANSVKDFLVSQGIDPRRVRTISYGKERPVALGSNEAAWGQNRRGVTSVN